MSKKILLLAALIAFIPTNKILSDNNSYFDKAKTKIKQGYQWVKNNKKKTAAAIIASGAAIGFAAYKLSKISKTNSTKPDFTTHPLALASISCYGKEDLTTLHKAAKKIQRAYRNYVARQPICPICLEILSKLDLITTSCNHQFHDECLSPWLDSNNTCPICRHNLIFENKAKI